MSAVLKDSFSKIEDLPPIELPSPPPLHTRRRDAGDQHVPLQVLGWAMTLDELAGWTDKHCPRPNFGPSQKRTVALTYIPSQLPKGYFGDTTVRDPDHPRRYKWCYFIANNKTQEDMDRTIDMAFINGFRVALDVKTAPQWYRVQSP